MSAALRLIELSELAALNRSTAPTMSPASLASARPSFRPSMRPTLVPTSRATVLPTLTGSSATEPPLTQRSASVQPRFDAAARHEITNLISVVRMNVDFLESLLHRETAPMALSALDDIHQTIDRLERVLAGAPGLR